MYIDAFDVEKKTERRIYIKNEKCAYSARYS